MNTDKNKQIHNARKAVRDLLGKLPDDLKNDPSVELLRRLSKENTVTVVHLIYTSKNYETSSKDYDFSRVAMVEHWDAGVARRSSVDASQGCAGAAAIRRDHDRLRYDGGCSQSPWRQAGVNGMATLKGKTAVVTGSTSGIGSAYARAFAGAGANVVINGLGAPADIETRALRHRDRFQGAGRCIRPPT